MTPTPGAWQRFRNHRLGWVATLALATLVLATVVTLPFAAAWYDLQDLDHVRHAPAALERSALAAEAERQVRAVPGGTWWAAGSAACWRTTAWWGLDPLGRSLLLRCLLGGALSLTIGLSAAVIAVTVGVAWGAVAGLCGGWVDAVMMRCVDVLYGLPYLLLVILLKLALETPLSQWFGSPHAGNIIILFLAIGATSWLTMARVIRGQVLVLRSEPYVEAARLFGASRPALLRRHLLPNLIGPIVVYGSLITPQAILSESFLSFLGIGVQSPMPTWGALAAEGLSAINPVTSDWWLVLFPCGLLAFTLVALNFLGDALRDAFDPRTAPSPGGTPCSKRAS